MYFALLKIDMDAETTNDQSLSHAKILCERISKRFKALSKSYFQNSNETSLVVLVTLLEQSNHKIDEKTDKILSFVETEGLGRVLDHHVLQDHVDALEECESEF